MDNLTHSLVGALIGQAGLKRKTGLAMPALIIGANIPDVDAACFLWLEGVEHLAFRRGITHGPIAWILLPLVLAGALWWWDRWQTRRGKRPEGRLPVRFGWLYGLSLLATLTHPALDWLNVYGVRLLEPFSHRWFYGDVLFIIDIWLWLAMGLATWVSWRRERHGGQWMLPARVGLAAALAYIGVNAAISRSVETGKGSTPTGDAVVIASPPPALSLARQRITGGDGLYVVDGVVLPGIPLSRCNLREIAGRDPQVRAFLFWSRTPMIEPGQDGIYRLRDARYYDPLARDRFTVPLTGLRCRTE